MQGVHFFAKLNSSRVKTEFNMAKSQVNMSTSCVFLQILVLSAIVLVSCEDAVSQVAQKRFGLEWLKGLKGEKKHEPPPPPENLPGGFGTYPLWKFHKFDGFSLRPVPMQLDIGYGIPPPPPTYMPQNAYGSGGYEGGQQSYAPPPPPPSYPQPSYGGNSYQPPPSYAAPPLSMGYQAVQPSNYGQPSYGPPPPQQQQYSQPPPPPPQQQPQQYSQPPPQQQPYGGQDMSYSPSAPQQTAVAPGTNFVPQSPTFGGFEGPNSFGNGQELSMPLDQSTGGFGQRYYSVGNNEPEKKQQTQKNEPDSKTKQ